MHAIHVEQYQDMKCDGAKRGPSPDSPTLTQEIDHLSKRVHDLVKLAKSLEDKLAPVLIPEADEAGRLVSGGVVDRPRRCPLSDGVVGMASEIDAMGVWLQELIRRLAL